MDKQQFINESVKYSTPYGDVYMNYSSKNFIVRISGGFDSAVMLYSLAKAMHENNATGVIRPITIRRQNPTNIRKLDRVDCYTYADAIINWVKDEFPTVKIEASVKSDAEYWWLGKKVDGKHRTSYSYTQQLLCDYMYWRYVSIYLKNNPKEDPNLLWYCEYTGTTKNPPLDDDTIPHSDESHRDNNDPNVLVENSVTTGEINKSDAYIEPFRNADKRLTFWLANDLGILDKVLKISRSCEGDPDQTDNFTKECGVCWWCLEREWANKNYQKTRR